MNGQQKTIQQYKKQSQEIVNKQERFNMFTYSRRRILCKDVWNKHCSESALQWNKH